MNFPIKDMALSLKFPLALFGAVLLLGHQVQAQDSPLERRLLRAEEPEIDCRLIADNAIRETQRYIRAEHWDSVQKVVALWQQWCGRQEVAERMRLFALFAEAQLGVAQIADYWQDYFYLQGAYPLAVVELEDEVLWPYLQEITILDSLAGAWLARPDLTADQRLFFEYTREDYRNFRRLLRQTPYKKSITGLYIRARRWEQYYQAPLHLYVSGGFRSSWDPELPQMLFPQFGFGMSSSFAHGWLAELHLNITVPNKQVPVDFLAFDDTLATDITAGLSLDLLGGYKLYDNRKTLAYLKAGAGLGLLLTDIEVGEDDMEDVGVTTLQLKLGAAIYQRIGGHRYLGLELFYQQHPYRWDSSLRSPLQSRSWSAQLTYAF